MRILTYGKRMSLALKSFLLMFCVSCLVLGVLTWLNISQTKQLFEKQVAADAKIINKNANEYINAYINHVQSILLLLSARKELFAGGNEETKVKILREYADLNRSLVSAAYVINEDNTMYSSEQLMLTILGNPRLESLKQSAINIYGGIISSAPYHSPVSQQTVAFMMPVKGEAGEMLGTIAIEMDLNDFTKRLTSLEETSGQVTAVITQDGELLTRPETAGGGKSSNITSLLRSGAFIHTVHGLSPGVSHLNYASEEWLAVKSQPNRMGWSVVTFFEKKFFFKNVDIIKRNYLQAALVWVLFLLIQYFLFTKMITTPIKKLMHKMNGVHDVEVLSYGSVNRGDEIGELTKSYYAMLGRIHKQAKDILKIESEKRDYEIRMLQNQIGPHFLYNTLTCINSLAMQHRVAEVQKTIHAMVGLLMHSMDKKETWVPLHEELEAVELYMQIQNIRYENKFELIIDFDPRLRYTYIPKLTLQPIVENAVFHGLVVRNGPGTVYIRGRRSPKGISIIVRDNGVGMDRSKRQALMENLELRQSYSGIGLRNVEKRMAGFFGSSYGLKVRSIDGQGTVVLLTLPETAAPPKEYG